MENSHDEISQEEEAFRYRSIVESMNDGLGIINDVGVFTYVNPRFAQMLEYLPLEIVGKPHTDFVDDVNRKILRENIRKRAEGQATQYELEWTTSKGRTVPTIVSGAPMINEKGEYRGSFAVITDITELRESRIALVESTEMMRRIFEESQVGIELFDEEGILIAANQAALDIGGISEIKDFLGFSLFDDPNVPNDIKARLIRGESVRYEAIVDFDLVKEEEIYETTRSGTVVLDAWVTPLGLENGGELKGYLSQFLERTEERLTEAALFDSEHRYKLLAENVTDIIFTSDLELNVTYLSPSVEMTLGYTADELQGTSLIEHMSPESVWVAIEAVKIALEEEKLEDQTLTRGDSPPLTIQLKRKDGSTVWLEVARTFMRDNVGRPTGILGVARNIEERRAAEKALRASETKYRTLIDQSFQGLMILQAIPLEVKFVNPAFANFLEHTIAEVLQFTAADIQRMIHSEDWEAVMVRLQELMSGEDPRTIPMVIRVFQKDGDMQYLEMFGRRVEFEGSPALQLVAINVTDRLEAERHIQTQKERAMLYLDLMSHDFRNQLQIILGSSMVMEATLTDSEARRLLEQITSAVERCQSMISKVKVTEPLMSVPLRPRKLNQAVNALVQSQKKKHLDVEFEVSLKPDNAIVNADQFLEQLLENLIENAIEHNPRTEKKVWVHLIENDDGFEIVIGDNGHGITDSLQGALFDVARRYGGVGLHQAKQICDKYDGRIKVRDRVSGTPNEGVEFVVWLPKTRINNSE
ncbi:MAG: PAS domain-containing sensor histidine kinase [Candidatus Thorarchaeota archaeon]|jgi:PAS domain S-box-containing protein